MKGNKKLLVIAALFLFVGVGVATYAIYKTSVSGTATVTAAKWDVKFKNGETELTNNFVVEFGASDCTGSHVVAGKIAPGSTCTKTITIDAGQTEVDVTYSAEVSGPVTAAKQINGNTETITTTNANEFIATLSSTNGTIAHDSETRTATLTLTVAWNGYDDSTVASGSLALDTVNAADTALNGSTITVPVRLVAKQALN